MRRRHSPRMEVTSTRSRGATPAPFTTPMHSTTGPGSRLATWPVLGRFTGKCRSSPETMAASIGATSSPEGHGGSSVATRRAASSASSSSLSARCPSMP